MKEKTKVDHPNVVENTLHQHLIVIKVVFSSQGGKWCGLCESSFQSLYIEFVFFLKMKMLPNNESIMQKGFSTNLINWLWVKINSLTSSSTSSWNS